ncbi:serine hydrolase [Thermopolyspora sp. NPDC052614]|uniref:serine hydrolase n=1 Tax=Thermopolyspora sp. NPDC052614 TaxID=3155682 RepID=UPI0034303BC9
MRISGGVLAIIVALSGAGCAPGRSALLPEDGGPRATAGTGSAGPGGTGPELGQAGAITPGATSPGEGGAGVVPGDATPGATPVPGTASGTAYLALSPSAAEQARRLTLRLDRYLRKRPGRVSVAAYDRVTGMRYRYGGSTPYRLADVAEVDILLVLLLRAQEHARRLTPLERRLATWMIRMGDDRAARRLYTAVGGRSGLARALRRLGITHTRPSAGRRWKDTRSVADDQLRVLDVLTSPKGPVNDRNRAFAAALLSSPHPARARGIAAAAAPRDRVAVKNGWHRVRRDRGGWTVNSAGRIISPSRDTLITVLSDRNPGRRAGRATVERVATMVMDEVRQD